MSIAVTSSLAPTTADTPLDARAVVATVSDIASLQMPYVGMLVYCKADSKYYTVTALTSRTIGAITVQNAAVGSYAEFPGVTPSAGSSGGSGGSSSSSSASGDDAMLMALIFG